VSGRRVSLFGKELRQIVRSRRTVVAASLVPALMLIFVTTADIVTFKVGFQHRPVYLLTSSHPLSATTLLRHFTLPILVTVSALVTPSIVMGDVLLGERERRTLDLLVSLPLTAVEVVLAKLGAVLTFAVAVSAPIFAVNSLIVHAFGYGSAAQVAAFAWLMAAAIAYSAVSALFIALVAGEPRAANIVSGLILGPVVPLEGLILIGVPGLRALAICVVILAALTAIGFAWSLRLLSFERLFGA
jgi:ABC-type transport system involved in multi-copper enzyme maturation permease subunit